MTQGKIQRQQRQWEKLDEETVDAALGALLEHEGGRKFLWRLLQMGRVGTQPFAANALTTSFNCGELNVGQQILDWIIRVNPAGYVRIMEEQANERRDRDDHINAIRAGSDDDTGTDFADAY